MRKWNAAKEARVKVGMELWILERLECVFWVHFALINVIYSLCSFCCADPCAEHFFLVLLLLLLLLIFFSLVRFLAHGAFLRALCLPCNISDSRGSFILVHCNIYICGDSSYCCLSLVLHFGGPEFLVRILILVFKQTLTHSILHWQTGPKNSIEFMSSNLYPRWKPSANEWKYCGNVASIFR